MMICTFTGNFSLVKATVITYPIKKFEAVSYREAKNMATEYVVAWNKKAHQKGMLTFLYFHPNTIFHPGM